MDERLRKLERIAATDTTDERHEVHRLSIARARAGLCAAHGNQDCQIRDCQLVMNIYFALQNSNFIEKYNQINQMLGGRAAEILMLDYPNYEIYDEAQLQNYEVYNYDPLPEPVYHDLSRIVFWGENSLNMLFGIWIPSYFTNDVVDHYSLGNTPYIGDRELIGVVYSTLSHTRGWNNFIYTAYHASFSVLKTNLEVEILKRISKDYPPLEIEQVLKGLPGYDLTIAADLIEKARAMLFLGEQWEAMGEETQDRDAGEDWHWLYCKKLNRPFAPTRRFTSITEWQKLQDEYSSLGRLPIHFLDYVRLPPNYVYVYGYPNLIIVKTFHFLDEVPVIISQQLDQDIVEIKMDIQGRYASAALPSLDKIRKAGLLIVVNDGPPVEPDFDYYDFIQEEFD